MTMRATGGCYGAEPGICGNMYLRPFLFLVPFCFVVRLKLFGRGRHRHGRNGAGVRRAPPRTETPISPPQPSRTPQ